MASKTLRADKVGEHRTAFDKNKKIILKTQTVCGICGQPVDFSVQFPHPLSPTIDHIIPISKGGHPSALENLQLAHRYCNRLKSNKIFDGGQHREKEEKKKEIDNDDLPTHVDWIHYAPTA